MRMCKFSQDLFGCSWIHLLGLIATTSCEHQIHHARTSSVSFISDFTFSSSIRFEKKSDDFTLTCFFSRTWRSENINNTLLNGSTDWSSVFVVLLLWRASIQTSSSIISNLISLQIWLCRPWFERIASASKPPTFVIGCDANQYYAEIGFIWRAPASCPIPPSHISCRDINLELIHSK